MPMKISLKDGKDYNGFCVKKAIATFRLNLPRKVRC